MSEQASDEPPVDADPSLDDDLDDDLNVAFVDDNDLDDDAVQAAYEERLAEQRKSALAAGRRKAGLAGAAMAGAMFALSEIIEGPPKEDVSVTVEASSDPHDLEKEGFGATVDGVDVEAPPLERLEPVTNRKPRR